MMATMIKQIAPQQAADRLTDETCYWLDIRDPQSWKQSHIKGAIHIDNDSLQAFVDATDRNHTLIIYCYHGNSSQSAAAWFEQQGFDDVYSLEGGFEVWRQCYAEQTTSD